MASTIEDHCTFHEAVQALKAGHKVRRAITREGLTLKHTGEGYIGVFGPDVPPDTCWMPDLNSFEADDWQILPLEH